MKFLNIGCGGRIHKDWVNIDKVPTTLSVKQCDVEKGLPFSDCTFDLVYHSHVLEHFAISDARQFLVECNRVLRPGGIIRIAVPDLEQIILCYLQLLGQLKDGIIPASDDYDWIMLEMYDQVVRNVSGGQMVAFLDRPVVPNRGFVIERCGVEIENLIRRFEQKRRVNPLGPAEKKSSNNFLSNFQPAKVLLNIRENIIRKLLGNEYESLLVGRFRCSGENHQWMYDRFSLGRLLEKSNFVEIIQQEACESYFKDWAAFNLDTETNGSVYKPESLYMEGIRS